VQAASVLAPNDSGTFFQLGFLRYNNKDYQGAVSALEKTIVLNPAYANAKYFLGLSYQKLGRNAEAIAQFKDLQVTNPDNKEVGLILNNLQAGRDPFANAKPPIDNKPEKRATPPVSEKVSTKKTTKPLPAQEGDAVTGNNQ
jgi:tetratricopeptide (TPR) repeat protein